MFAAVDLGSNSFRLHIARREGDTIRVIKSARDPIRLGAGLDVDCNLTPAAISLALQSLARFKLILASYPLSGVRVVATNAMRVARNSQSFLPLAEEAIGYPIEIISGEEEGRLIYMGVASTVAAPLERRLVLDIGGGSTELIVGAGQEIEQVDSFSTGTVSISQDFFIDGRIDQASFNAAILSTRSLFEDAAPSYRPQHWSVAYGSSGTLRAIGDAISKNGLGDGTLTLASLDALRIRMVEFGHVNQILLTGMKPDRAAVIVGGLSIVIGVMQELNIDSMLPIEAGLRMGVLWDLHLRATKRDRREQSVRTCLHRFHVDEQRAERVADYAVRLHGLMKPSDETLAKYLYWSGLLHETGLAVSHSGYHKHSAYLIEHADLPGFTTREQRTMSNLIVAQKGNLRKLGEILQDSEFARAVLALRLAVLFSHARLTVEEAALKLKMKSKIEIEMRSEWIAQHPTVTYWMQKERACWNDVGIEFAIKVS